jgi:hypothetical protein
LKKKSPEKFNVAQSFWYIQAPLGDSSTFRRPSNFFSLKQREQEKRKLKQIFGCSFQLNLTE